VSEASAGRLSGKVAIVTGAGQTPGDTVGNGRATALVFAREGARLVLVDRNLESALETERMIRDAGGECISVQADVSRSDECRASVESCVKTYGRLDVLHNNVGIGTGDGGPLQLREEAWDRIMNVNLKSVFLMCKHALPVMREQESGCILNVSSIASICSVGILAYKTSKAGVNALTHSLALGNARYGIRVNAILPGLMNTPMAIDSISRARQIEKEVLIEERDRQVPLGHKMGTAWDVANAALFLASEEARFITGVLLPVDGGQSARVG
jgi:NAD(P)-dependent dehydrogenase (short-subunit alcohol dehydrogenase family)